MGCLGLHNKHKTDVHLQHLLTDPKEEEGVYHGIEEISVKCL
jgi:hypothetical protein